MKINCDMGESFGLWRLGDDASLMPRLDMANVACGFHAGDPVVMRATVALAAEHGVQVGAHPSYPDLQGFGRRAMVIERAEVAAMVIYQAGALKGFLDAAGIALGYIKPHGALYGRAATDAETAHGVADAAEALGGLALLGMAGTVGEQVYRERGLAFMAEFYADLEYRDDGSLIITREHPPYDPELVRRRTARVISAGLAESESGKELPLRADCVCVHSDTPNAVEVTDAVRAAIDETKQ